MRSVVPFICLLGTSFTLCAQDVAATKPAKAIYVEALGSGLGLSIHYDTRFKPGLTGLGLRAGIGGIGGFSDNASVGLISVPVLLNYVVGNSRAAFEAGAGLAAGYVTASGKDPVTNEVVSAKGLGLLGGAFNFGLRLQPKQTGAHFRLYWSPFITDAGFQPSWFGASLGVGFR